VNRTALIIAIALAGLGGTMLWLYKQRFEAEVSGGPPVAVAMLARDVPLGTVLAEADLAVRSVPSQYVEGRHVRAADVSSVVGVRTANQLRANESLLWTDLASASTFSRNLSGLVRVGMRAVALDLGNGADFSGLVRPGDRVDLMLTVNRGTKRQTTHAIAQAALVVAVGADTGGPGGAATETRAKPARKAGISVALTAEHAALVTHARSLGELSITLRNPDDVAVVDLEAATQALADAAGQLHTGRDGDPAIEQMMGNVEALTASLAKAAGGTRSQEMMEQLRGFEKAGAAAAREAENRASIPPGLPRPAEVQQ
jgi:pilus assembly protein CpaB